MTEISGVAGPRWPALKDALRKRLSPQAYAAWVSQMSCLQDDGQTLKLGLPDGFSLNWVNDHYRHVLEEELAVDGIAVMLFLEVGPQEIGAPVALTEHPKSQLRDEPWLQTSAHRLNPRYTFTNFVVGPSNELAWAGSKSVVENPTPTYSPLVIVGGVGLGKTHLLHAIGHLLLKRRPPPKVLLKTSEEFISEVVQGIRMQRMDEVRRLYRQCDVLLIDDIQFISGKEVCQEEFFHTFNALYDAQKPIVVTSDRLPHEISDIQERLRTRFAWGLIADLKMPELETRMEIVRKKAAAESFVLEDSVVTFLAQSVRSSVRELEGALIRVHAYGSLTRQPITLPMAKEVLKGVISEKGRALNCEVIVKTVAGHFDLKTTDLRSDRRARNIAFPRQIAMYLCRRHTGSSYPEIGQALGGKDHTTALNAFNRIQERLRDPDVRAHVEEIERVLLD